VQLHVTADLGLFIVAGVQLPGIHNDGCAAAVWCEWNYRSNGGLGAGRCSSVR
jgi:hypothetical protein